MNRTFAAGAASLFWLCLSMSAAEPARPNVLFIAIDDLNDWAGPFGGNPQCRTPNIDQLAREGAVVFRNNHCPGPVCGPSRSAILSGFMPHATGAYGNRNNPRESALVRENATLPEYFAQHGYHTVSRGKIFHAFSTHEGIDRGQWAFEEYHQTDGRWQVDPETLYSRNRSIYGGVKREPGPYSQPIGSEFAWGATSGRIEDTPDHRTAVWAAGELHKRHEKPFFMAVGITRPHLPFYAPKAFYDLYPLDEIEIPEVIEDDLDDIRKPNGEPKFEPTLDYLWMREDEELFRRAVRAYMASSSYADHCLGVILDALRVSDYADNTIVIVWGDHGWHLGEKLRFRKATLWSESTRAPLLIKLPGASEPRTTDALTNLQDLFPTLIDLCGLPAKQIDGRSVGPLLDDKRGDVAWDHPALTIRGPGASTVRYRDHRYTDYGDGTVELYDLASDPYEHVNLLAGDPKPEALRLQVKLAELLPPRFASVLPVSERNDLRQLNDRIKSTRDLSRLK